MRIQFFFTFFVYLVFCSQAQVLSEITSFGYHERFGVPRASYIKLEEKISSFIVGGSQSSLGLLPYQAGLLITLTTGQQSICGGSLISTTRVLTAAHCWWDGQIRGSKVTIVLGSLTINSGGSRVDSTDVVPHSLWNPEDITHDIAMIKMAAVTLTNNIKVIGLPAVTDVGNDFSGLEGTASGYGKITDAASLTPVSATLYHKELSIITNAVCQRSFELPIHTSHLCTNGAGGVGTCDGDSGGPLVVTRNGATVLVGIASFGLASGCQMGYPSVFTRVTAFSSWISTNM